MWVIEGGLAGLASAVCLAEAGKQVTILERRGSLGDRTHAIKVDSVDDLPDSGQHVIASGYERLFRYRSVAMPFPPTNAIALAVVLLSIAAEVGGHGPPAAARPSAIDVLAAA